MPRRSYAPTGVATFMVAGTLAMSLACSSASTSPGATYHVLYTLQTDSLVLVDSIEYDDGHGAPVTTMPPTDIWNQAVTVPSGGSVQVHAWLFARGPTTIRLIEQWTASGISTGADTALAVVSAKAHLDLVAPKHALP
ncbi:MAG TPA: hypothetical protein VGI83_08840 [Gemmatimonadales bacterium]|jgi:hypothetical protein